MKTASINWCRLIIFHSGFWLVLCVSKTRSRLDVASRFQSAQHSMKALVLDDWIRMQVLGNSVAIEFVILFALFKLGGKFDITYLMVLWLKASTTNCFSSSFGWKCVMWFIMFVMFPKYFRFSLTQLACCVALVQVLFPVNIIEAKMLPHACF